VSTVLTQTSSGNTAITFDISSLATSATWAAGRASTQVDNTSNNYTDALVNVINITGGASAPTIGQTINLYVWGANTSLASQNIDVITGTDGNFTLGSASILQSLRQVGSASVTVATGSLKYVILPFSVAQQFGGILPKYWGLYLAHNQTGSLAAAQSALFSYNGITYTNT
jgi:hypothetical protein